MTDPKDRDFFPARWRRSQCAVRTSDGRFVCAREAGHSGNHADPDSVDVANDPTVCEVCGNLADGEPGRCHLHFRRFTDATPLSDAEVIYLATARLMVTLNVQAMSRRMQTEVIASFVRAWLDGVLESSSE